MKLTKQKSLNEAIAEMSENDYGAAKPVYADAVRNMKAKKDQFEKDVKNRKISMPNEEREAHKKVSSNEGLKKMHLSESMFTEWVEDEPNKILTESFAQPDIVLEKDDHIFEEETGNVLVDKSIFDDYMENAYINIQFADDNDDKVLQYKMISEDDEYITMEYIGEATPGIDEEIAGCQKYPVKSPFDKKDSNFVKADQKFPVNHEEAVTESCEDPLTEKAAEPLSVRLKRRLGMKMSEGLKEDFTNWDSPESRIERYMTDLPPLLDTMYDHFNRGNIEAQVFADALKVAYDALDSVPHIDEELDASQKYPVETPFKAKDSQFISKEDKTPNDQVKSKDSEYISAGDKDPNKFNQGMKESLNENINPEVFNKVKELVNKEKAGEITYKDLYFALREIDDKESKDRALALLALGKDSLDESTELEEGGKKIENPTYIYMSERDPLGDIIQAELTEGEWGYVQAPDGKTSLTRLPSANYLDDKVTADWDRNGNYAIYVFAESEEDLQPAVDVANKYQKEYKIEKITRPLPGKEYCIMIYVDEIEDFEKPYFDPNVRVRNGKKKEEVKDDFDESIEDNQKFPIESPIAESIENTSELEEIEQDQKFPIESPIAEEIESSQKYPVDHTEAKALVELRISTEGLRNFRPYGEVAVNTYNKIVDANKLETLEFMLEDMYPNGIGSSELNDLLTYDNAWVLKMLNLDDTNSEADAEVIVDSSEIDDDFDMPIE